MVNLTHNNTIIDNYVAKQDNSKAMDGSPTNSRKHLDHVTRGVSGKLFFQDTMSEMVCIRFKSNHQTINKIKNEITYNQNIKCYIINHGDEDQYYSVYTTIVNNNDTNNNNIEQSTPVRRNATDVDLLHRAVQEAIGKFESSDMIVNKNLIVLKSDNFFENNSQKIHFIEDKFKISSEENLTLFLNLFSTFFRNKAHQSDQNIDILLTKDVTEQVFTLCISFNNSEDIKTFETEYLNIIKEYREIPFMRWESSKYITENVPRQNVPRQNVPKQIDSDHLFSTYPQAEESREFIEYRQKRIAEVEAEFCNSSATGIKNISFVDCVKSALQFGCYKNNEGEIIFREWVKDALSVSVRGEFSKWEEVPLKKDSGRFNEDVWMCSFEPKNSPKEGQKYQFVVVDKNGETHYRVPASASSIDRELDTGFSNGVICFVDQFQTSRKEIKVEVPVVYEAHVGVCAVNSPSNIGSFTEFRTKVLPHVKKSGYNTICFMGIQDHLSYSTFGWHTSAYYSVCSTFGTINDFNDLVKACHDQNIKVWLSLVHSHAAPVTGAGLSNFMGSASGYLKKGGIDTICRLFDSHQFNLSDLNVLRFLLGQISYWACNFNIDGFRLENVETMLYTHQAVNVDFGVMPLSTHFDHTADVDGHIYIALFSKICAALQVDSVVTSESVYPGITHTIEKGGLGISYLSSSLFRLGIRRFTTSKCDEDADVMQLTNVIRGSNSEKMILSCSTWDDSLIARRPMKIAFFTWESMYTHPVGGVAPHVTCLSEGLARLGHEVHIFTRATQAVNSHKQIYGVHYHECQFDLNSDFVKEVQNMCGSLKDAFFRTEDFMNDKFAIAHAHDWLAVEALAPIKCAGRTSILTIHSTEYGRCGNNVYAGQSKRVRDIEEHGANLADRIIAVSGVLADEVKQFYNSHPDKLRVIYNGIEARQWDGFEDAGSIKSRYGINPMQPVFLFVGRMAVQKGPDLLVDSMPEILAHRPDAVFIMVGNGHMKDSLEKLTNSRGLGGNVRWLGAKMGDELKQLFKAADAVVVPSRNEPFGIVVLEAWAAYKPVIATTCGGPRDFVTHDVEGFLVDPNAGSIAWGCKKLLDNFEHARWMGERGRVKAAFVFTWDNIAAQTRDVYNELLNRGDCPYGVSKFSRERSDLSLLSSLVGKDTIHHRMSVFDNDSYEVDRGLAMYNIFKLLSCMSNYNGGYNSFAGTEFGNPNVLDLPRPGNNFSKDNCTINWSLKDNTKTKFKYLFYFDKILVEFMKLNSQLFKNKSEIIFECNEKKTMVVKKGSLLIIVNIHPTNYLEDFIIPNYIKTNKEKMILSTQDIQFGGLNNEILLDFDSSDFTIRSLPSRTGCLVSTNDDLNLSDQIPLNVDDFIQQY